MKNIFIIINLLLLSAASDAQPIEQLTKLIATDRAAGNQFGNAVSISGNYAVIGASDISDGGIPNSCNCVYVFEKKSNGWTQVQKLTSSDPSAKDGFGKSVSINRSYIIVGAPGNGLDGNNANDITAAGAVYIFKRNSTGSWLLDKKIVAPDRSAYDLFGTSVSIASAYDRGEGSYVLVGAPGDADYGGLQKLTGAGSAYFITNLNGYWEVYHKVVPIVGTYYDRSAYAGFGTSVSISVIYSGTVISAVVGAPGEKKDTTGSNPMDAAGAAYVYQRGGSGGLQLVHKIVNWDRAAGDQFGYSVSIDKNQLVVGAPFEDEDANQTNTLISAGSAYVFNKMSDGRWWWVEKLIAPGRAAADNFGLSVCIRGDSIIAGASTVDDYANGVKLNSSGAAYVFKLSLDSLSSGWRLLNKISATDRAENDWFGYSVGIDGENIIVGAPFHDKNIMTQVTDTRSIKQDAGAIYVFGKKICSATSSSISPAACKSYTSPSNKYTWSATGTYSDIIPNKAGCDSIITINLTITTQLDTSVTQTGNTLTANINNANYQWIDCKTNQPININTRSFIATVNGTYKVSIEKDGCKAVSPCYTVKPTDPSVEEPVQPVNTAPVSNAQLKEFVEINKLIPKDRQGYENFGYSVAISGDYAVIGANVDDKDASGKNPITDAGSAYIFKKDKTGKWKEVQKIVASDREPGDNFGWSVAISYNHIVVGAVYHDKDLAGNNQGPSSGAAYVFELGDEGVWIQKQKIIAFPVESQILFGYSVAIDGNTIAVGCPSYAKDYTGKPETNINAAGAVFVFDKTGGAWAQSQLVTAKIRTIDNLGDGLGSSVSICGDLIIAGAWSANFDTRGANRMQEAGAAYIFQRTGGRWTEVQKIVPQNRAPYDKFGYSVAISGDNAIIGAWNKTETDDPNSRPFTGNAYIFSRRAAPGRVRPDGGVIITPDDGSWKQVLKINPVDRRPDDYLGWSVSMSGDYAIVSAKKQDSDSLDNMINDGGAIYVFYQDKNGRWSQTGKLVCLDRSQLDQFGHAVAISRCDFIGASIVDQEDDKDANAITSAGSAYVFSAADCRNVAPCYRPKLTPDIKTPIGKNDSLKINMTGQNKNETIANMPGKIQPPDLNSKGNEVTINNVELTNEGLKPKITINKDSKTDSLNKLKPVLKKN